MKTSVLIHPDELSKKWIDKLASAKINTLGIHPVGGREAAEKFMCGLRIAAIETHVADARSCCLHPASTTHRQLSDAELASCGVSADLVRFSCGLESAEDLIADIDAALSAI